MADKPSLKNKHLRDGDYFAIIGFCSHSRQITLTWTGSGVVQLNIGYGRFTVECSRYRYVYKFGNSA